MSRGNRDVCCSDGAITDRPEHKEPRVKKRLPGIFYYCFNPPYASEGRGVPRQVWLRCGTAFCVFPSNTCNNADDLCTIYSMYFFQSFFLPTVYSTITGLFFLSRPIMSNTESMYYPYGSVMSVRL